MRSQARTLAVLLVLALAACGVKRPPAITSAPPPSSETPAAGTASTTPEPGLPLDSGPDVQPLRDEGAAGQELSALGGEEGPLADVYFDFDSAALSDEALALLARHARWLSQQPDAKVTIEGHCDQRGTVEYNLALGDQRAQAVREYLVGLGVAEARLRAVSFGKERPLDPEMSESAWAKNRRAHFVVSR